MTDISPELLKSLQDEFTKRVSKSQKIMKFIKRVRDGTADFENLGNYASDIGDILADTFKAVITDGILPDNTLYWNIAESAIKPMILQNVDMVNDACIAVQSIIDQAADIGLKSIRAPVPADEIKSIMDAATVPGIEISEINERLSWSADTSRRIVDSFIETNAKARNNSGYRTMIIRRSESKCCEWCQNLAGSYEYNEKPDDIFRRHNRCRCSVIYKTGKTYQDVYSKQTYSDQKNATDEQAQWLSKYDAGFDDYKNRYVNYQKLHGYTEKKALDMFNASKTDHVRYYKEGRNSKSGKYWFEKGKK